MNKITWNGADTQCNLMQVYLRNKSHWAQQAYFLGGLLRAGAPLAFSVLHWTARTNALASGCLRSHDSSGSGEREHSVDILMRQTLMLLGASLSFLCYPLWEIRRPWCTHVKRNCKMQNILGNLQPGKNWKSIRWDEILAVRLWWAGLDEHNTVRLSSFPP